MTKAVDLALGVGGVAADPLQARQIIMESNLDGKTKLESIKALEDGTMGKRDDPAFLAELTTRIITNSPDDPVADGEILAGIGTGKLTFETKDKLLKLKENAAGKDHTLVKYAFKSLDDAFAKSFMAGGTPEQAAAHFAAQYELLILIAEAQKKGTLKDILNPASKNFVLPGIMVRNQLTMDDQIKAMMNRLRKEEKEKPKSDKVQHVTTQSGTVRRETANEFLGRRFLQKVYSHE